MVKAGQEHTWQVKPVPTGVPGLDPLIDGGLTQRGLLLIVGGPGVGKTVLAEQMAFHWAAQGHKVLWVVLPGEPNEKLLTHLSQMRFFDRALVGQPLQLVNLSRYLDQGSEAQMGVIRDTVQAGDYAFVIIDGFQNLRSSMEGEPGVRRHLSELSSELALSGVTLIITTDADPNQPWVPEFTLADAIIHLTRTTIDGCERRQLQVLKQRGRAPVNGLHPFQIDAGGLRVYPRLETVPLPAPPPAGGQRQTIGLAELDQMLSGGLLEGSSTLLTGSPGTGKTLLAGQFLAAGLREGQPGLYLGFFESLEHFFQRSDDFGMALRPAYESGLLQVWVHPSGHCLPDACAQDVLQAIEEHKIRRLVLDGLNPIERELLPSGRIGDFLSALVEHLRARGVTTIITREATGAFDPGSDRMGLLISQIPDNAVHLRFTRTDTRHRCLLSIIKTRYSDHSPALAELFLSEGRLEVVTDPAVVKPDAPELVPVAFRGEPQAGHYY